MSETYEMSAERLEALRAEVHELETNARAKISAEIKTAREYGDLKENAEYHAAKDAQGMLERRILQLRDRLNNAVVVTESGGAVVSFGSIVQVRDEVTGNETTYTLVSSLDAAATEGKLSVDSPVAQALRGTRVGDLATVATPRGQRRLRVIAVS